VNLPYQLPKAGQAFQKCFETGCQVGQTKSSDVIVRAVLYFNSEKLEFNKLVGSKSVLRCPNLGGPNFVLPEHQQCKM